MVDSDKVTEFWETAFLKNQGMWGFEPSRSAVLAKDFFVMQSIKSVLIPGIGYGRNAQIFKDNGMEITGIEISGTAIDLARKHFGENFNIYHGSVTNMPFDEVRYDGIFCYALIHLLNARERKKLIRDCYDQLVKGGYMIFTAISKKAHTYRKGNYISKDRYEVFEGIRMYFYDSESVSAEFKKFGLFEVTEVNESYPFLFIKCRKQQ